MVPGYCNVTNVRISAPVVVTSVRSYADTVTVNNSDDCCSYCHYAKNVTCNIMAFCVNAGGCGSDCKNGPPHDPATTLGPYGAGFQGVTCLPNGAYPVGTCQLLYTASPLTAPVDTSIDAFGWVSAVIEPETQPNLPDFPHLPV